MPKITLKDIRTDGGTQPREAIDQSVVADYREDMQAGAKFPPVVVYFDGENNWLGDGFHRVQAAKLAGFKTIDAEVRQGTQQDAQWFSFGVNGQHGLRRSAKDKRRAIRSALLHPLGAQKSDRQIAEHVGVDHKTVANIRADLESTGEIPQSTERKGKDGRVINTSNIGKTNPVTDEEIREVVEQVAEESTGEFHQLNEDEDAQIKLIEMARVQPGRLTKMAYYAVVAPSGVGFEDWLVSDMRISEAALAVLVRALRERYPVSDVLSYVGYQLKSRIEHEREPKPEPEEPEGAWKDEEMPDALRDIVGLPPKTEPVTDSRPELDDLIHTRGAYAPENIGRAQQIAYALFDAGKWDGQRGIWVSDILEIFEALRDGKIAIRNVVCADMGNIYEVAMPPPIDDSDFPERTRRPKASDAETKADQEAVRVLHDAIHHALQAFRGDVARVREIVETVIAEISEDE